MRVLYPATYRLIRARLTSLLAVVCLGCTQAAVVLEDVVPWQNFQSDGWYAVDPSEYGDCAVGLTRTTVDDADALRLEFHIEGQTFATFRNHELETANWSDRNALVLDVENECDFTVGLTTFLSSSEEASKWQQSARRLIPPGTTKNLRIDLKPIPATGPQKDWPEEAWQFLKLDRSNVRRIAFRLYADQGQGGTLVVSNPRFAATKAVNK